MKTTHILLLVINISVCLALLGDESKKKDYWLKDSQTRLLKQIEKETRKTVAKNIIMFIGDGLGISTSTAARLSKGVDSTLAWEEMEQVGLAKTYCLDSPVADSACSATAYLGGVKANQGTVGLSGDVPIFDLANDCPGQRDPKNRVDSFLEKGQRAGKATGLVTDTRVTHASPASTYSHVANRLWENDRDVKRSGRDPKYCDDIAKQMVRNLPGKDLRVILGGGKREFVNRLDNIDLIEEWGQDKAYRNFSHRFIQTRKDLLEYSGEDFLLGLFSNSHLPYHYEQDAESPSLTEMTRAAIKKLSKDPNGYVLFVEAGRIDHAHHSNKARKAVDEVFELDRAVREALAMTNPDETLIVVTADHSHGLTVNGYPENDDSMFGLAGEHHGHPVLAYSTGPGPKFSRWKEGFVDDMEKRFPSMAHEDSADHTGEEVAVYSSGPHSHLLTGVFEQSYIPAVLAYAGCFGDGLTFCG